jgi:hypothetical protein
VSSSSPHAAITAPMMGTDSPITAPRRTKSRRLIFRLA